MNLLTKEEYTRYSRTILLDGIGERGQKKLLNSSVLIVGTGALGSIVAMYLAASGIGRIGIVDFDIIDMSNLQRQLSFYESDIGKEKVEVTASKLHSINSSIKIDIYSKKLLKENAFDIFSQYDFIVEGSDNPSTKYMVIDTCHSLNKPYCIGGIAQYCGQVTTHIPGSIRYDEIFPEPAKDGEYKPCSIGGVLGPLPGIIGSIQAAEAIKYIIGIGDLLTNKFLTLNALNMEFKIIKLK